MDETIDGGGWEHPAIARKRDVHLYAGPVTVGYCGPVVWPTLKLGIGDVDLQLVLGGYVDMSRPFTITRTTQ